MKYIVIPEKGAYEVRECGDGNIPLTTIQRAVQGYFETAPSIIKDNYILIVNEEGKLNGMKINRLASELLRIPFDAIFGPCMIAKVDGEDIVGFNEEEIEKVKEWL